MSTSVDHENEANFKDKCGVIGVFNSKNASTEIFVGLHALQHRGQEAGGISTFTETLNTKKHHGTVFATFSEQDISALSHPNSNTNYSGIGHVRYSTSGSKSEAGIQPFAKEEGGVSIALAHNGNLTNYEELKQKVLKAGIIPNTQIDTELILHLIFMSQKENLKDKIIDAVSQIKGAFSLVIIAKDFICAIRDEFGIRPLAMGSGKNGEIFFASETCALDAMGAKFTRNIKNGEFVFASKSGLESVFPFAPKQQKFCIFEYVYFARPDSILEDRSVYQTRKEIGKILSTEHPVEADVVVAVPDSGVPSAIGYSLQSGIPFELGIIRSHYIGRTFIDPSKKVRANKVVMKHNPNRAIIEGKRVVLIDDSIVRGTTSKKIVSLLFDFGAKEVHFRVASPPTKHPCFYGIDTPNKEDLIAHQLSTKEICEFIGATTLQFISLEGLKTAVRSQKDEETFCDACFTGEYFV